jgi:uncharacterized protein YifE (UPF0438 family)
MAFQIDPNIPLQAMANPINIGESLARAQTYQTNALKLQALRDEYNAAKDEKLRQKQMRQGMASELQKLQQGTPAQYNTTFPQTMPTGQMPQGMTGVLANERGQNMPQPALFGENILQGNFDVNREMVSPAIAPKQPDIKDVLTAQFNAAMATRDVETAFDAAKKLKELEKNPAKYFQGLTEAVDASGKPILLAMTETGAVPSGYSPKVKEKEAKPVPVMENGVPKTVKVPNTNEVKILMSDGTLMSGGSIPAPPAPEKPMTKYQGIKLEGELRDDYRKDSANFVEISRQGKIIEASLKDPSSAATLASATAFMKMLDPESVVRESELAMAMKTEGLLGRMGNYMNVIESGQVLTENQKTDFARLIKAYREAANQAQNNLNKKYSQISTEYGLDPKRVAVYDVEKDEKPKTVNAKVTGKTKIVKSRADLDKVKSGESYIAPDGKLWVKP